MQGAQGAVSSKLHDAVIATDRAITELRKVVSAADPRASVARSGYEYGSVDSKTPSAD
jgi:hypothetical protein